MMNATPARFVRFGTALLGLIAAGWMPTGRAATSEQLGFPTDWSHRHLVFSRPATAQRRSVVEADPRYWQQWARRNIVRILSPDGVEPASDTFRFRHGLTTHPRTLHRDWSVDLGAGASIGADNFPAKYTFQTTTANCAIAAHPDYVVFNTGLLGSSSQPSVVALDNLYSGCGAGVPTDYWAYNTGGQVLTSPIISFDGTQVAFVQTTAALNGTVVLLKWAASSGTVAAPVTLTAVSNAAYRSCTAPCMTTIGLRNHVGTTVDDRTSSIFPDYTHDVLWVGGTSGWLHKITGAFVGAPTEVTTGAFPVQMNSGNQNDLSSPVYDYSSGNVFVGDYGGFLYRVNSTTGAVTASGQLDHGTGLVAGPIVDSTAGKVYVFSSSDGTTSCTGSQPCSAVYALSTSFPAGAATNEVQVGAASATPSPMYEGDFDSSYQNSANGTGNLYVCGNTGGPPILYQIPINAGTAGAAVTGPVIANATTGCSPVSDVYNPNVAGGATEWIFAGVNTSGILSPCGAAGCIMNFKNTPWLANTLYANGQEVLDSNFQIQAVSTAGRSGTAPTWSTALGGATTDSGVTWINQGPINLFTPNWAPATSYTKDVSEVIDSNGNVELCTKSATSPALAPVWPTAVGAATVDPSGPDWVNVGHFASVGLKAAGGSSGISMDNVAGTAGASQIYFSTLSDQACGATGTGGCAVQASQSALQ